MQPKTTTNIFKHMLQHKIPEKQQTLKTIWKIIWKKKLNKHQKLNKNRPTPINSQA